MKKTNSFRPFFPLTLPQQDVYYDQLLHPESPMYNIGAKIVIRGKVDVSCMKRAYDHLIDQADAYRSVVSERDGKVGVEIMEKHDSELGIRDFSSHKDAIGKAHKYMRDEFMTPFHLSAGKLLHKFVLIKVSNALYYLFSMYHHIITDGWGTSLMFQRLVTGYNECIRGRALTEFKFSYQTFWQDDQEYQRSEDYAIDKQYWLKKFTNLPDSLIPLLKENKKQNHSKQFSIFIKRREYDKLYQLSREMKVSVFHCILGLLYTYFGRVYLNPDFAIGIPTLNRGKAVFKQTVGLFMGISPLRITIGFENTFRTLCVWIKEELRKDYRSQRFPIGKLIKALNCYKEKEKIFNLSLSYEKQNYSGSFASTDTEVIPMSHESEQLALGVYVREFDDSRDVKIDFDYNLSYFTEESIGHVAESFQKLLGKMIENPDEKIKDIDFLSDERRQKLLFGFNKTQRSFAPGATVLTLFSMQAKRSPDKIAVWDRKQVNTYRQLDEKAEKVAAYLQSLGKQGRKSPIGVLMKRSVNLLAVLLGILKSGRPYVPLDPSFPAKRLRYIIAHSKSTVLITDTEEDLEWPNTSKVNVEDVLAANPDARPFAKETVSPKESAYIIYTSGSTGDPKGVEIAHESLANFLLSMREGPGMIENEVLYAVTTCSFDISVLELFLPIVIGGTVFIASDETLREPSRIVHELAEISPDVLQATPSFYHMLYHSGWQGGHKLKVLCGGDSLSESLAGKLLNDCREVWNMYGPTETTIWSAIKQVLSPEHARCIGKPIHNTSFYVLDPWLQPMPENLNGYIYIGGRGLAKGYYRDNELTTQQFIPHPFEQTGRIYNTGDIGKWNSVGEIEFLGREDNQVKLRGYRIELGEIEKKLVSECNLKEAVVIAKKDGEGDAYLVGFVKEDPATFNAKQVVKQLKTALPEYMIPRVLAPLLEFPLTPNKKVDRKALSQLNISGLDGMESGHEALSFEGGGVKYRLKELWEETLGLEVKSEEADFFELGGHSVKATQLIGLINNCFAANLEMNDIFNCPTLNKQAERIEAALPEGIQPIQVHSSPRNMSVTYPLADTQEGLWLACQDERASAAYNMYAAFEIDGDIRTEVMQKSIELMIRDHEILRTNFVESKGTPRQRVTLPKHLEFTLPRLIFSEKKDRDKFVEEKISVPFDLRNELLFHACLLEVAIGNPVLLIITHHLLIDGESLNLIAEILKANYNALLHNRMIKTQGLQVQFKDYSIWHKKRRDHMSARRDCQFWLNEFEEFAGGEVFGTGVAGPSFKGGAFSFSLEEFYKSLKQTAAHFKTTVFSLLLSSVQVYLHKTYDRNDFCLGIPVSVKDHPSLKNTLGMFVNTLPLRCRLSANETFATVYWKNKTLLQNAIQHKNFSIYALSQNNRSIKNLFDVVVAFQHKEFTTTLFNWFDGMSLVPYPVNHQTSRFPLTFNFIESEKGISCTIEYNTNLFDAADIALTAERYKKLLKDMLRNPDSRISDYVIELELERQLKVSEVKIDFNF